VSFATEQALEDRYVMHTFGRKPVELVSGNGMEVFDDTGKAYLDFIGGIGVNALGHCHPAVVAAIQDQAAKLIHVSNYYYIEGRGELARTVSHLANYGAAEDAEDWQTFFANSGAEANECMMKLARAFAKRQGRAASTIVTLERSFHGRTMETLAATAQPAKQELFQPLPGGFVAIRQNDVAALEAVFEAQGDAICGFMFECIQGESGVHPCTPEFLQRAAELCRAHGALMLCDEVQTGVYRTGTPFAFQQFGIDVDIFSMAKGIAGGFPMGACAARAHVAAAFEPGDHGSTFGGSNLAVAAARATLKALEDEDVLANVNAVGAYLRDRLAALPFTNDVRGRGLMVACDITGEMSAPDIVSAGLEAGLLLNATGPATLRFLPPLICSAADIDVLVEKLASIVK
jgi:acetylornithine/N-succinyldiaminopimelate aminotransferase